MNNIPKTEEFERCIKCGALTCVPISMPVDWRENYEVGLGQLCVECAKKQEKAAFHENAQRLRITLKNNEKPFR